MKNALLALACLSYLVGAPMRDRDLPPQDDGVGHFSTTSAYRLGPEDVLAIRVLNADEIASSSYPIDLHGEISLLRIGRVRAGGLTIQQLESTLMQKFSEYLKNPTVIVSVSEFRSQPVLVLGEVTTPGVHQIRGRKTLFEVISAAGGLKADAGNSIKLTRPMEWGPIPLPNVAAVSKSNFTVADINIRSVMDAKNPQANIPIMPNDIITVPKAELVYVLGAVRKPGGFVLSEKASISVLEAVASAEGLDRTAGSGKARILRSIGGAISRQEIPVDVQKIMTGKKPDVPLLPNDILFIPNSAAKTFSLRAIEALIQTGTGFAIYHPI